MRIHCFKECITISHSNDYNRDNAHYHTVEVATFVKYHDLELDVTKVEDIKKIIDSCFEPYYEKYLNDMEGFEEEVTIEHLGEQLFWELNRALEYEEMFVERLEIGETPLRTYIITRTV